MKAIAVQLDIVWEDKSANFAKVSALLERMEIEAGSLIVLPEMFATGFSMNVAAIRESEANETGEFLQSLAQRYQSFVIGGVVTQASDGRGRNEALIYDPSGQSLARYCKLHPFSFAGETNFYCPGESLITFAWGEFTVAPLICYDLRFPEVFRHAVQRQASLFAVLANWPQAREAHWITLLQARAIENQAYVIGVNRCGNDPKLVYSGRSLIIDPRGQLLADAESVEGAVCAEVDFQSLDAYRRGFPALSDIRAEYR